MKARCIFILLLACVSTPAITLAGVQATFYVSPNGSDSNPGTEMKPFATIEKARQAVRAVNATMTDDIVVVLRGGVYRIDQTFVATPEDSGSAGHNVIYRAQAGETPIISGNHVHDNPGVPGGIYLDEGSGFIEVADNLVYDVQKPMNYNNVNQNRKDTCKERENLFGGNSDEAKPIIEKAGLEAAYRNLLKEP